MFELSATRCSFRKHLERVSDEEDGEKEERKKKKCGRETGLRGGKGRKLANWLAVVIQFKMDDGRGKERGLGV